MTHEEKQALATQLGSEATSAIDKAIAPFKTKMDALESEVKANKGGISEETLKAARTETAAALEEIKEIARKQGLTLAELQLKAVGINEEKTMIQTMDDHAESIRKAGRPGNEQVEFMMYSDAKGELKATRWDSGKKRAWSTDKAAGPHATIGGVGAPGNTASVTQVFNAASILRMGSEAPITGLFRNTPWLFDLINVTGGSFDQRYALWIDEAIGDPAGSAATVVPEGGVKPLSQYKAIMRSAEYKKHAHIMNFTEEFVMDFERLYNYFLQVGRVDVLNKINDTVLADLISIATPYTAAMATDFKNGDPVTNANDYDALVALATQSNSVSFGAVSANAAVMSTQKQGRISITKNTFGDNLKAPSYLDSVKLVGNPSMVGDDVVVGDLSQYNLLLRGGMLVAVGLNGNDFSENKFTVRQEQYYFNYISELRKAAILKGQTFAAVKSLINI